MSKSQPRDSRTTSFDIGWMLVCGIFPLLGVFLLLPLTVLIIGGVVRKNRDQAASGPSENPRFCWATPLASNQKRKPLDIEKT